MRLIGRIIIISLAVIGSLTLLFTVFGLWAATRDHTQPLPKQMVLMLDLDQGVAETPNSNPFAKLQGQHGYVVKDVVETLDRAAHDPSVVAVAAKLDSARLGMGKAQEIRDAIREFRKSGKRTLLFSSSLGEFDGATVAYYTASAFQEIWLQPSGDVGLTGFMAQSPFIKDALDMVGIKPEVAARWEYKSAIDMFTQRQYTKENRESVQLLIDSYSGQVLQGIADARGLTPEKVRALIDKAPLLAQEAKDGNLIDRLAYWDEAQKSLTEGGAKIIDLNEYAAHAMPNGSAAKVALIYGTGTVQKADGDDSPFGNGDGVMSSDRITQAFRDAVKDKEVKAILFRIDSPGGSYTASDAIWREVVNARAAGKPVVVSMSDVAASGGYFAAMAADKIVAQPGTITGSIGVFSGKPVLAELWKKLGVSWDEVHTGQNAGMFSVNQSFTPSNWDRLNAILDHIYADFTGKAVQGRHLKPGDMDGLARGRIWPGVDAKRLGLVDELGGFTTAEVLIRQVAKLPSQMPINLAPFPKPREPLEYLLEMAKAGSGASAQATRVLAMQARLAQVLEPLSVLLANQPVRMPPVEVK